MRRTEAAAFLGVSLRTLDRISASGKLTKGIGLSNGRPCVEYRQEEIEALRAELQRAGRIIWEQPFKDTTKASYVAFRIDPSYLLILEERGREVGLSANQFARHLVIRGLESKESTGQSELTQVIEALAAIFYALLTAKLGSTPNEARKIVDEAILKRKGNAQR